MTELKEDADKLREIDQQHFGELMDESQQLFDEKEEIAIQSADKDIKIKNLMKTNLEIQTKMESLTQLVDLKDDLADQLDKVNNFIDELQKEKGSMRKELETAGDYLLEQEEKTSQANQNALELLGKLKEADQEIESLKEYIIFLKSKMNQYVPVKGDHIDETLADYINNYHDKTKLQVMFIRLNPGIYQFGSKKIWISVE